MSGQGATSQSAAVHATAESALMLERYFARLGELRHDATANPALNPTAHLAYQISHELEAGEISVPALSALTKSLSDRAFVERAAHLGRYVGVGDEDATQARLDALIDSTMTRDGKPVTFEDFAAFWGHPRVGAVFTAHPTFGMSRALRGVAADLATPGGADAQDALSRLAALPHEPDPDIALADEHADAQVAVERLQHATAWLGERVLQRAQAAWPEQWHALDPAPLTLACWVGYDLDGRTDIGWQQMIRLRLDEKAAQLARYHARATDVAQGISGSATTTMGALVEALAAATQSTRAHAERFDGEVEQPDVLADAANALTAHDQAGHVTSVAPFVALIDTVLADLGNSAANNAACRALVLLRADMKNMGLGTAHLHFRLNATQLHNGFSRLLEMNGEAASTGRMQLSKLNDLIARAESYKVSFRSLMHEGSTAIRQFILIAQILKHIDSDTPVRFLIAECESAFTVLVALYFARLFGVEHKVDISPLFETPAALEKGVRILEQLVDNERYLSYVRLRGRIAIQTGFSDAGRFIGQVSACLAIERLQIKLARMLGNRGMSGIEVLIFNTHGESMGRGAHPGSMADRFDYVLTPAARRHFERADIPLKHETSFQGGDGYLLFASDALARASLCAIIENARSIPAGDTPFISHDAEDRFYRDTDFSLDFFLHLKAFQEHLFEDEDYRITLGTFGTNLLFKTGSRRSIRQHEISSAVDRGNPRQMRAIPHNAILQQLGYVAHVVSGVGSAVGDERDRFVEMCGRSDRAARFMDMIARAKRVSSINTLSAYARTFDPGYWVARAYGGAEGAVTPSFRALARLLKGDRRHEATMRLTHHLREDAMDLHEVLDRLSVESGKVPDENRLQLDLLHAVRIALIEHIFVLAAQIPPFASRNDITPEQLMSLILSLDITEALAVLREVFPAEMPEAEEAAFDEETTYDGTSATSTEGGYRRLHNELIDPIAQSYDILRHISVGISHHFLAHG